MRVYVFGERERERERERDYHEINNSKFHSP